MLIGNENLDNHQPDNITWMNVTPNTLYQQTKKCVVINYENLFLSLYSRRIEKSSEENYSY